MTAPSKEVRDALQHVYNDIAAWDDYERLSNGIAVALEIIRKHMNGNEENRR